MTRTWCEELGHNFTARIWLDLILFRGCGRRGIGIARDCNNLLKMVITKLNQSHFMRELKTLERWISRVACSNCSGFGGGSVASDLGSVPSPAATGQPPLLLWCTCQELLPRIPQAWFQVLVYPVNLSCCLVLCSLHQLIGKQFVVMIYYGTASSHIQSKALCTLSAAGLVVLTLGESPWQQSFTLLFIDA